MLQYRLNMLLNWPCKCVLCDSLCFIQCVTCQCRHNYAEINWQLGWNSNVEVMFSFFGQDNTEIIWKYVFWGDDALHNILTYCTIIPEAYFPNCSKMMVNIWLEFSLLGTVYIPPWARFVWGKSVCLWYWCIHTYLHDTAVSRPTTYARYWALSTGTTGVVNSIIVCVGRECYPFV